MRKTKPINTYKKKLNKNKRNFLAVKQRRYQFKHTKTLNYLKSSTHANTHMQTHTRKHTHANTDIHAHVSLKFAELNDSLNHQCVTMKKNFVYSK